MIIRELYLKNFGRFSDRRIVLTSGINLITGRNESGKTTGAQFIRAMLFGMKKGRGRASGKDVYHRYAPWGRERPEGSMVFECNGREFRLNRSFPDGEELFCIDDGEVLNISEGDLEVLLGGLGEGLYVNTVHAGAGEL